MAEEEQGVEEKKSSKKIIIIAAAAVIVLLLAGGAGYYFMQDESADEEAEQVEEIAEEEDSSEELYYDLEKSLIVNFPNSSSASLVQVSVSFLVKGEEGIDALKKHDPMIRNNLLMAIAANNPVDLMTQEGKESLRADMLKETKEAMNMLTGKDRVINLFFTAFVMQ